MAKKAQVIVTLVSDWKWSWKKGAYGNLGHSGVFGDIHGDGDGGEREHADDGHRQDRW